MARRLAIIVAISTCTCFATTPAAQSGSPNWDAKFRELPEASNIRASMQRLSARPHHVGSPYDKDNAEWILQRFKEWGWDAQIETFSVLFPTPKERLLELVAPTRLTAKLTDVQKKLDGYKGSEPPRAPTPAGQATPGEPKGKARLMAELQKIAKPA